MKKISTSGILLLVFALLMSGCLQVKDELIELSKTMRKEAIKYGDFNVATTTTYALMVLNPQEPSWRDSLAQLYFQGRAYVQCMQVAQELIESRPEDTTLLEMLAVSKQNIGDLKGALEYYEKLYEKTKKPMHLYQKASIEMNLKRYQEAIASIQELLQLPDIDKKTVVINFGQGQRQVVPMKAAVLNMYGVLAMDVKQPDAAEQYFLQALEIFPDFVLAKGNLEAVRKQSTSSQ